MTNIYLSKFVPATLTDKAGDVLSAVLLVLSGVLALVTLATV